MTLTFIHDAMDYLFASGSTAANTRESCGTLGEQSKPRRAAPGIGLHIAVIALVGCTVSGTSLAAEFELVVPPALEVALASHRPRLPVSNDLVVLDSVTSFDHPGNLGQIATSEKQAVFRWLPDGRLSSTAESVYKAGTTRSAGSTAIITLCGLITLLSESAANTNSQLSSALSLGRSFLPFGFSHKSQGATRSRISRFGSDVINVCAPEPGASFSFRSEAEVQRKLEGTVLSSNSVRTAVDSATCVVGGREKDASDLHSELRGAYLEVDCTYSEPGKPPRHSLFAFLQASGMYISISVETSQMQLNRVRYTSVEYR